jgi:hypothetical protein
VPSNEEIVLQGYKEIEEAYADYVAAARALNALEGTDAPAQERLQRLQTFVSLATRCYNSVEKCIAQGDLLGAHQSDFLAGDFANTSANFLEKIPAYWRGVRRHVEVLGLNPAHYAPRSTAYSAMQNLVVLYCPDKAGDLEKQFREANLPIRGFTHPRRMNTRFAHWEKIAMWSIVVSLLLVMLAIGLFERKPTDLGIFIFRTVLALLAGAFAGIFIPGFLDVKAKTARFALRATGAAAFFVIVYLWNPPALVKNAGTKNNLRDQSTGEKVNADAAKASTR